MIEVIFLGLLTNFIYDIIKTHFPVSINELHEITNYNSDDCSKLVSIINECPLTTKDEVLNTLKYHNNIINEVRINNYKTNFSIRLDYLLSIIRKYNKNANIEWLCHKLDFTSSNELLKYYRVSEEPTFEFIDDVANRMGISSNWLKFGEDNEIFSTIYMDIDHALMDYIRTEKIASIYFAFSKNSLSKYNNSEIIIVFKFNDLKYIVNSRSIPFGAYVGGEGTRQICNFYIFLLWLQKEGYLNNCHSVSISEELRNNLTMAKEYGRIVSDYSITNLRDIIYDFIDLEYTSLNNKEDYVKIYGKPFLECQDIIRNNKRIIDLNKDYYLNY